MEFFGLTIIAVATTYLAITLYAAVTAGRKDIAPAATPVPVSLLKPLHGDEPRLYENLKTFCVQDYPRFQIIFGVQRLDDPAAEIARLLQSEFPQLDIEVVVDARRHGSNPKVNNLINLCERAKHPWLVMADSDIAVTPDYLNTVTAPLADAGVGVVTCLYRGKPRAGVWSRLGAQFINDWFAPSVLLTQLFGVQKYCAGATLAMRAEVLKAIGGFAAVKDQLADDYWLGELPRRMGLRTVLSPMRVITDVTASGLRELWQQELRWMHTTRSLALAGFVFLFVTMTLPMLALGLLLSPTLLCAGLAVVGLALRIALHLAQNPLKITDALLIPLRDFLLLAEWLVALPGGAVHWRGQRLDMDSHGSDKLRPRS